MVYAQPYITYIAFGPPFPSTTPSNTAPSPHWLYDLQDIHYKLMHSFHNRQICSLEGVIVSAHRLCCPARFPFPPSPPAPSGSKPGPHAHKTSALSLPDIKLTGYTQDELMHYLSQLSVFVPLTKGFNSFRAQTD